MNENSKFGDGSPASPFGQDDLPDGVDANVSLERLGVLDVSNATAAFVDEWGNRFPVESPEIAVDVEIVDGIARVRSVVIDNVTADAVVKGDATPQTVEMLDEHMRPLAEFLAKNLPKEVARMGPTETMVDLVIRLLGRLVPKVEQFDASNTTPAHEKQWSKRLKHGG